jgi:hypothetical protein
MNILRIVHGLANNIVDISVPPEFNLNIWRMQIIENGGVYASMEGGLPLWINLQWIQHAILLTPEQASELATQGMTKQ